VLTVGVVTASIQQMTAATSDVATNFMRLLGRRLTVQTAQR
jgi:hypothetical protein